MENVFKKIDSIELILTEGCNLRCKYCYQHKTAVNFLKPEVQDAIIDMVKTYENINSITLFGGEPMHPDNAVRLHGFLSRLLEIRPFSFHVTSNMFEVTDDVMKVYQLLTDKATDISLQISMDGTKEIHDFNRIDLKGHGSWDAIISNIKKLKHLLSTDKWYIVVHNVITPGTMDKLWDLVDTNNKLQQEFPFIKSFNTRPEHGIVSVNFDYDACYKAFTELIYLCIGGYMTAERLGGMVEYEQCLNRMPHVTDCGTCLQYVTITPDGDLLLCHMCGGNSKASNNRYYNIVSKEWGTNEAVDNYYAVLNTEATKFYSEDGTVCKDCNARGVCTTCKISNWFANGDLHRNNISNCMYYKAMYKAIIDVLNDGKDDIDEKDYEECLNAYNELLRYKKSFPDKTDLDTLLLTLKLKLHLL